MGWTPQQGCLVSFPKTACEDRERCGRVALQVRGSPAPPAPDSRLPEERDSKPAAGHPFCGLLSGSPHRLRQELGWSSLGAAVLTLKQQACRQMPHPLHLNPSSVSLAGPAPRSQRHVCERPGHMGPLPLVSQGYLGWGGHFPRNLMGMLVSTCK